MTQSSHMIDGTHIEGYCLELNGFSVVCAKSATGFIGCGVFAVAVFDRFAFPAARVQGEKGRIIETVEDLLAGTVVEVNQTAEARGVMSGMNAAGALCLM